MLYVYIYNYWSSFGIKSQTSVYTIACENLNIVNNYLHGRMK